MRNRNNNGRHTIWTEHFTIRSYLKDFSEFNQGSVHDTVLFTGSAGRSNFTGPEHNDLNISRQN